MHTHTLPVSVGVGGFGPSHDNTETIGSNSAPEEESHQKREQHSVQPWARRCVQRSSSTSKGETLTLGDYKTGRTENTQRLAQPPLQRSPNAG